MVILTTVLLILLGVAFGLARRAWWEMGILTLVAWGSLQVVDVWIGNWRNQVGLPRDAFFVQASALTWLLIGVGVYVSYGLAYLYSRRRLPPKSPGR
jgi:hypothetical protein